MPDILQLDLTLHASPAGRFEGTVQAGDGAPTIAFAGTFELVTLLERLLQESAVIRSRSSRRDDSPSFP